MKCYPRLIVAILVLLHIAAGRGFAQYSDRQQSGLRMRTDTVEIFFRQNYSKLEPAFRDNALRLDTLKFLLENRDVRSLTVRGSASPEGRYKNNINLSRNRALHILDWIKANVSHNGKPEIKYEFVGEDYDGLLEAVLANNDVPSRERVIDIIKNTPVWISSKGIVVDGKKRQLQNLDGGKAWDYMYKHIFPNLRGAITVTVSFQEVAPPLLRGCKCSSTHS